MLEKQEEEEEGTRAIFDQLLINEGRTSTFLDKISSINFFQKRMKEEDNCLLYSGKNSRKPN